MTTLLWRIDPTPAGVANLSHLADDLALHLRYAPLTTVLVQIGSRQQAYLSAPACEGCRQQRCAPDCAMQLLRRALIANQAATHLRPVPLGLTQRPYTRLVLAVPGPHAKTLEPALLAAWPEARLWASWRMLFGRPMVAAGLAVGATGPNPLAIVRSQGWHAIAAQPLRYQYTAHMPAALPFGWVSQFPPLPFLSHSSPEGATSAVLEMPDYSRLAPLQTGDLLDPTLLSQALATLQQHEQPHQASRLSYAPQPSSVRMVASEHCSASAIGAADQPAPQLIDWPAGPAQIQPERLGQLLTAMVQSPTLTEGRPGRVGLAIPRLKNILGLTKSEASALLCWLDQADLVEPPMNPLQRWRNPRPLITTELTEIATKLQTTPLPTEIEIVQAFVMLD